MINPQRTRLPPLDTKIVTGRFIFQDECPAQQTIKIELIGPIPCWYFATGAPGELTGSTILPNDTMTLEVTNTKRRKTMKFTAILTCYLQNAPPLPTV